MDSNPTITAEDITERKRAEDALRESDEKYRMLVEGTNEIVYSTSVDGVLTYVSPQAARYGWAPEELISKSIMIPVHEDDRERVAKDFEETVRSGKELVSEFRIRSKAGEIFWFSDNGRVRRDAQGNILGTTGVLVDITERKRAEDALRESEAYRRAIFESARDTILIMRGERFIDCNPSALVLFGTDRESLIGHVPYEFSPEFQPDGRLSKDSALEKIGAALNGVPQFFEWKHTRKDGTSFDVEVSLNRVNLGKDDLIQAIVRDVSERKRANEALADSEARFRTMSDHSLVGIYIIQEGKLTYVNSALAEICGYHPDELFGASPLMVIHPDEHTLVTEEIRQRLSGEVPAKRIELHVSRKDGDTRSIDVFAARAILNNHPAIIGNILDITERKLTEQKVKDAAEHLAKTLDNAILTMAKIVEMRDPYTAGHQEKVTQLAVALAREINLEPEVVENLRMAALIHDIGKISVPAEMLSKPGKLTSIELLLIKEHAQSGYEIVRNMNFHPRVALAIWQHHERLDGSGYPNSLKGDNICIEAKILAVADVVEAIVSHRPYRPALGIDIALGEITQNRGKLFEPTVVDACARLFREKEFSFTSES